MSINVKAIVKKFLEEHGFDGLYSNVGECGCRTVDLMPCDFCPDGCAPGYLIPTPDADTDWMISAKKQEIPKEEDNGKTE
jgi:hypothetical protein